MFYRYVFGVPIYTSSRFGVWKPRVIGGDFFRGTVGWMKPPIGAVQCREFPGLKSDAKWDEDAGMPIQKMAERDTPNCTRDAPAVHVPLPTYPYGKSLYKPYIVGIVGL